MPVEVAGSIQGNLQQRLAALVASAAVSSAPIQELVDALLQEYQEVDEQQRKQAEKLIRAKQKAEFERNRYQHLFQILSESYLVTNREGKILEANPAAVRFFNLSPSGLIGQMLADYFPEEERFSFVAQLSQMEPGKEWRVHLQGIEGQPRYVSLTLSCESCQGDRTVSLYWFLQDLTAHFQIEETLNRQTAFVKLLQLIIAATNEASTIEDALQIAVNQICVQTGWPVGHVYFLAGEGDGQWWDPSSIWYLQDPTRMNSFRQVTENTRLNPNEGLLGRVLATSKPTCSSDIARDNPFARTRQALALGFRFGFAFPILVERKIVAILEFFAPGAMDCDSTLFDIMGLIGAHLGHVIERDRRHKAEAQVRRTEDDLEIAQEIHRRFFPATPPVLPGFEIAAMSYPAQATGGDYFDYIPLLDKGMGIVIGDVSGHGFGPALMMAQARAYLRALSLMYADLSQLLTLTNKVLIGDIEEGNFMTLFFARLDSSSRRLTYAGAGHEGYLISASKEITLLKRTALPLGVTGSPLIPCGESKSLEPGDLLLVFTDGIPETSAPSGNRFGNERVLEIVKAHRHLPAADIIDAIYQGVLDFSEFLPQRDDITAVVVKVEKVPSPQGQNSLQEVD